MELIEEYIRRNKYHFDLAQMKFETNMSAEQIFDVMNYVVSNWPGFFSSSFSSQENDYPNPYIYLHWSFFQYQGIITYQKDKQDKQYWSFTLKLLYNSPLEWKAQAPCYTLEKIFRIIEKHYPVWD
jgi:hypothetical protein